MNAPYLQDADVTLKCFIERAAGRNVIVLLHELKELRESGWDVTALLCPDQSVIGLGYCALASEDRLAQQSLFAVEA